MPLGIGTICAIHTIIIFEWSKKNSVMFIYMEHGNHNKSLGYIFAGSSSNCLLHWNDSLFLWVVISTEVLKSLWYWIIIIYKWLFSEQIVKIYILKSLLNCTYTIPLFCQAQLTPSGGTTYPLAGAKCAIWQQKLITSQWYWQPSENMRFTHNVGKILKYIFLQQPVFPSVKRWTRRPDVKSDTFSPVSPTVLLRPCNVHIQKMTPQINASQSTFPEILNTFM